MHSIDPKKLAVADMYKLLIGSIVPRPIAWVSTVSKQGITNLAPFSFFNAVCSNPPSVLFCPVNHPDGREKDTLVNIREVTQFVVNITSYPLAEKMNQTSGNYSRDISEFKEAGVTELKSNLVKPPRVAESPIQFECELIQIVDIGDGSAGSGHVVIGKIVMAHFANEVYDNGKIILEKLEPIGRMAGTGYVRVRETFDLERPKVTK